MSNFDWNTDLSWDHPKKQEYKEGEDEDGNFIISDKILKRLTEKNCQIIKKVDEIKLPQPQEQLRLITMHPFNAISIVSYIAKKETIEHAKFVIFAINQFAAKVIIDLYKSGKIQTLDIIVSSIRNAGHVSKSKAVDMLKEITDITFVNSHAKISILKTETGYYNIEGSGNFSFNGRLEQYVIDNDKILFDFSEEWINELKQYSQKPKNAN